MTNNTNDKVVHTNDEAVAKEALSNGKAVISDWTPPKVRSSLPGTRDLRNFRKGYQEALNDIIDSMAEGDPAKIVDWIFNNGDETTRAKLNATISSWGIDLNR